MHPFAGSWIKVLPDSEPDAVLDTFKALQREGKIRAIGFCNSSTDALQLATARGDLDVDQERYSLLDREREEDNLPICREHGLAFLAYSPIAQGLLTGKIDAARSFGEDDLRHGNARFATPVLSALQTLLAPLKALAADRGATVEQLVLAWTLQQPGLTHVLVGTRNVEQARSNAAAGALTLSADEMRGIDQAAQSWPGFTSFSQN